MNFRAKATTTGCAVNADTKTIRRGGDVRERWTSEIVEEWIEEAVETAKLLPGVRPIGYRNYWPEILATKAEIWGLLVDGHDIKEKHNYEPTRLYAENDAIDRFDEVQRWMNMLSREDVKILWCWGLNRPDRWVARKLNTNPMRIRRHRIAALKRIARKLNIFGKQPNTVGDHFGNPAC